MTLLTLLYQDLRDRRVSWLLFPVLVVFFVYLKYASYQLLIENLTEAIYPAVFLVLQLLLLTVYFSIRTGRLVLITNSLIGLGDIMLLISLCFYFNLYTYVIFYILSLIVVLVIWVLWQSLVRRKTAPIPFAGLQALVLSMVLLWSWTVGLDLGNDYWILKLLR